MSEKESYKNADVMNQHTGEKWYYSDIVKDHFFNPRNLLWEVPNNENEYDAVGMVGSPACLLPSTLLQKNPVREPIERAQIGDNVLSHDGHFYSIKKIFRPLYQTSLVRLKNQIGEITATADHLIYAIQVPRKQDFPFVHTSFKKRIPCSWVHAGDLKKGDIVLYPIPKKAQDVKHLPLPLFERKRWDFKSKNLPRKIFVTSDLLELFGYFVAEGHTKDTETGFTFGIKETVFVQRVIALVKRYFNLDASVRIRKAQNRIDVSVYNVYLATLFREWFGHSAATKKVPAFLLFLAPEKQKGFLRGLWRGDGYINIARPQPRAGFVTVSETLIHQVIWLLLRQKIVPSVYSESPKIKQGVSHQKSYRIHVGDMTSLEKLADILRIIFRRNAGKRHAVESWFDDRYLYLPIRDVSVTNTRDRLYNLEVESSHTYATDAFLVHNCGDMMQMWMKIDKTTERIQELKWKTFGCGSAIAATSMFSVMVTENGGVTLADALAIKPTDVMTRLGGLPDRKIHCSVLCDKAFARTANDYFRRTGQHQRVIVEGAKVIDKDLNITDRDIEEAVLEGARDLEGVQQKLKVGIGNPETIPEVEKLIEFYVGKYYG